MPIFIFLFGVNYFSEWSVLLPLVVAVYIGTTLGKPMLGKLRESTFRILFKVALTLIAIRLLAIELFQLI